MEQTQQQIIDKITHAIQNKKTIEIEYKKPNEESTLRVINPHNLFENYKGTILVDSVELDNEKGQVWKMFDITKIKIVINTARKFIPDSRYNATSSRYNLSRVAIEI
jgi:predicted DNA-binding transcriptional regulator YafY